MKTFENTVVRIETKEQAYEFYGYYETSIPNLIVESIPSAYVEPNSGGYWAVNVNEFYLGSEDWKVISFQEWKALIEEPELNTLKSKGKLNDEDFKNACNKAYKQAGVNAYFANGFKAGYDLGLEQNVESSLLKEKQEVEKQRDEAVALLETLYHYMGGDSCRKDHHGYCQEHLLEEDCTIKRAGELIKSIKIDK